MSKVSRTSVVEHYGIRTLMYGTLLPGPDIGRDCAGLMRSVRDAGFEVGIHTWDHIRWQDHVARKDLAWTATQMQKSVQRFEEIFAEKPLTHGAAGWQMNDHAYRLEQEYGFDIDASAVEDIVLNSREPSSFSRASSVRSMAAFWLLQW